MSIIDDILPLQEELNWLWSLRCDAQELGLARIKWMLMEDFK